MSDKHKWSESIIEQMALSSIVPVIPFNFGDVGRQERWEPLPPNILTSNVNVIFDYETRMIDSMNDMIIPVITRVFKPGQRRGKDQSPFKTWELPAITRKEVVLMNQQAIIGMGKKLMDKIDSVILNGTSNE